MNYETITYDLTDGLAVVTLNRPDVMNALNTQMRAELFHAVKEASGTARALAWIVAGQFASIGEGRRTKVNNVACLTPGKGWTAVGVGLVVDLAQVRDGDVGVDLRRDEALVAQKLLYGP